MQQKLCELFKKLIKVVGHDIRGISRTGPQNMQSHAVVSTLDLRHLNVQSEMSSGESSAQWLHQLMQDISCQLHDESAVFHNFLFILISYWVTVSIYCISFSIIRASTIKSKVS